MIFISVIFCSSPQGKKAEGYDLPWDLVLLLVLVLGDLRQGGLDEVALHVTDRDGELVDLEVAEDDLALQEEHLALEAVPLVEVLLADLLQVVHGG